MTVAEYLRDPVNPDIADPNSRRVVLSIPHPRGNHNGGQLQFGPDGFLYLATGDGGGGGDPDLAGQNLGVLPGKLLRINPNLGPAGEPYTVPADNPFVGQPNTRPEIWAYGLRNPWRFSFDRQTGNLTIGDVGQGAWEEIDFALAPNCWPWHELRLELHGGSPPVWQLPGAAEPRSARLGVLARLRLLDHGRVCRA